MTELILNAQERTHLQDLIVRTSDVRILRRAYALLWSDEGKSVHEIAAQLKVSRQTVYNWLERFHERADDDLMTRLSDAQRKNRPHGAGIIDR
jgi:transposase